MVASSQARQAARRRPVALTIAGSDNSAGAGAQADLKTFSYFGCYGLTAITCVVAEVPGEVAAIQAIRPAIVAKQIALSLAAFPVAAAKTGMLRSAAIVEAVAEALGVRTTKLVVDPVMVASSGDPLLKKSAIAAYERALFPGAALVTPNLDELRMLTGRKVRNLDEMREAGGFLVEKYGCPFLLKGGHLRTRMAVDLLVTSQGVEEFAAPFVPGIRTHGTGCTYSAAIAANLALGASLSEAVSVAKKYVTLAIGKSLRWEKTHALEHFPRSKR
ncbi:MAG TPA: bifunctional hydroxymethylpyrimidine kinase/phosphomethylpyrimidine kinase [Terrimicrobium sp.]